MPTNYQKWTELVDKLNTRIQRILYRLESNYLYVVKGLLCLSDCYFSDDTRRKATFYR